MEHIHRSKNNTTRAVLTFHKTTSTHIHSSQNHVYFTFWGPTIHSLLITHQHFTWHDNSQTHTHTVSHMVRFQRLKFVSNEWQFRHGHFHSPVLVVGNSHREIGILNSCTNSSPFVCFVNTRSCDLSSEEEPGLGDVSLNGNAVAMHENTFKAAATLSSSPPIQYWHFASRHTDLGSRFLWGKL